MKSSEFLGKLKSFYLWGNLLAMLLVVLVMGIGVRYGLNWYTHHGEAIMIPNVKKKSFTEAESILKQMGLKAVVSDTGYVKTLPPDCVLEQSPAAGEKVKAGRIIYLTINASKSPTITLPDVIDNSSCERQWQNSLQWDSRWECLSLSLERRIGYMASWCEEST